MWSCRYPELPGLAFRAWKLLAAFLTGSAPPQFAYCDHFAVVLPCSASSVCQAAVVAVHGGKGVVSIVEHLALCREVEVLTVAFWAVRQLAIGSAVAQCALREADVLTVMRRFVGSLQPETSLLVCVMATTVEYAMLGFSSDVNTDMAIPACAREVAMAAESWWDAEREAYYESDEYTCGPVQLHADEVRGSALAGPALAVFVASPELPAVQCTALWALFQVAEWCSGVEDADSRFCSFCSLRWPGSRPRPCGGGSYKCTGLERPVCICS
jgi:hypothetical protein